LFGFYNFTMRILPINYNLFINPLSVSSLQQKPLKCDLPQDSVQISFKGDMSYLLPAREIDGIHCPNCGAKMLTQASYDSLVERAGKINTTQEFIELLREYKDYVPKNMRSILRGIDKPEAFANKDFKEFFIDNAKYANYRHRNHVSIANSYLLNMAEELLPEEKAQLQEAISQVSPTEKSYYYRQRLYPIIKGFKSLDDKKLFAATKSAFAYVRNSCDYYNVFRINNVDDMSVAELSQELVKRVFAFSCQKHTKISQILPEDWVNNEVLVCKRCDENSVKNIFLTYNSIDNIEFDSNLRTYLTDLAYLMGKDVLPFSKAYLTNICNIITKFSKEKISFTEADIRDILRIVRIASRHEDFEPTIQTKVDVPCAGCSSTMLPHDVKKEIDTALLYCRSTKDYMDVVAKYKKYVGEYSNELVDIMYGVFLKNPDIEISQFYKKVLHRLEAKLNQEVYDILHKYKKGRSYLVKNGSLKQLETMDLIYKRVYNYIYDGKFNDYNYKNLVIACLDGIDLDNDCTKSTYIFLEDLKKIAYKYNITQPNLLSGRTDKNLLHTTIFNLFKASVGTGDHLDALALGGSSDKYNMVGLCKACNNLKGRKSINSWFSQNINVRKNFDKHLLIVDKMSKDGIIFGYEDWAKTIADKVYKSTYGRFDMRYLFEEGDSV